MQTPDTRYEFKKISRRECEKDLSTLPFSDDGNWHHVPTADPACGLISTPHRTQSVRNLGVRLNYAEVGQDDDDEEDPDYPFTEDFGEHIMRGELSPSAPLPDHLPNLFVAPDKTRVHKVLKKATKSLAQELAVRGECPGDDRLLRLVIRLAACGWPTEQRSWRLSDTLTQHATTHKAELVELVCTTLRGYGWIVSQNVHSGERALRPVPPSRAPVCGIDGDVPHLTDLTCTGHVTCPWAPQYVPRLMPPYGWVPQWQSCCAVLQLDGSPTCAEALFLPYMVPESIGAAELQRTGVSSAVAFMHAAHASGTCLRFRVVWNAQMQRLVAYKVRVAA